VRSGDFLSPVAPTGSVIPGTYLIEATWRIEPLSHLEDSFVGGEFIH
jgi:hypothetical protein